jgi:hypothetical protein
MNNTVEALRAVYVALGGDSADVADIVTTPEIITMIATIISSGATAELPAVTTANNGEVLTVVSGEWKAAALPE